MMRKDLQGTPFLAVISHARTGNVEKLQTIAGPATWFVGKGEGSAYLAAGAAAVHESGPLCRSRNAAIEFAQTSRATCLQLSDDLMNVKIAMQEGSKVVARKATFAEAVERVLDGMFFVGAHLGGVAPTNNTLYAHVDSPTHPMAFIVGDFIAVSARCNLRFNENMGLKEDYDYTLQHLEKYGRVARRDDVLMTFLHRKNAGGAVDARTPAVEQANIAMLKERWPGCIVDNPKRPNEILLKLPKLKRT